MIGELYAYMSHDEAGNEALLGVSLPGIGWVPLTFRTQTEGDVMAPFAEKVRESTGREVYVKRFVREVEHVQHG
jgi:hypothetical protein